MEQKNYVAPEAVVERLNDVSFLSLSGNWTKPY